MRPSSSSFIQLEVMSAIENCLTALGKLFRRLFLARFVALHDAGRPGFFGSMAQLGDEDTPPQAARTGPVIHQREITHACSGLALDLRMT